jgi:hypothetical protein
MKQQKNMVNTLLGKHKTNILENDSMTIYFCDLIFRALEFLRVKIT